MKNFFMNMINKPHMARRIIFCVISVCMMGVCIYWLDRLAWGTDPYSVLTIALARMTGISLGTIQAIYNSVILILVLIMGKEQIGLGTVFNMFLVGYSYNFMGFVMDKIGVDYHFPKISFGEGFNAGDFAWNVAAMLILLVIFVISVATYMSVELGAAPYDAMSKIVFLKQKKLPFRAVRIIWDTVFTLIGVLFGGTLGAVTVLAALTIGPAAEFIEVKIKKFL
ncbi:MAG: hypothetical protein IKO61_06450 [Lachnospiraceae bacterium]|nr:hypothetical protein [Lachnospiraceae bacterium]